MPRASDADVERLEVTLAAVVADAAPGDALAALVLALVRHLAEHAADPDTVGETLAAIAVDARGLWFARRGRTERVM